MCDLGPYIIVRVGGFRGRGGLATGPLDRNVMWSACHFPLRAKWHRHFCSYCFIANLQANPMFCVDKKNQLDVTFYILYFSSNSCSTCFGQPCAHHQELTTAWCDSLVLVCAVAVGRLSSPYGRTTCQLDYLPETCWATIRREIKNTKVTSSWFFLSTLNYDARSATHQIFNVLLTNRCHISVH